MLKRAFHRGVLLCAFAAGSPILACSSCGCTLNSDFIAQGLALPPGTRLDLRVDYLPQTVLQTGMRRVDRHALSLPAGREIERYTDNLYVTAALDHAWSADWGINVAVPLVYRPHATVAAGDTNPSFSRYAALGDARVVARYQGFKLPGVTGIQVGIKLPTGGFRETFRAGPQAGEDVDRGLQPGTGTTDAIVGAYHFGNLVTDLSWFAQVQALIPLDRHASYRPGTVVTASAGLDYTGWQRLTPQLQLNFRNTALDRGDNSDRANSGGRLLYLSPGMVVPAGRGQLFAFAQIPLVQDVVGYQLVPRVTASAGVRLRL